MNEERRQNAIGRDDLNDLEERIKQHVDCALQPITQSLSGVRVTMYGPDGRNGVVDDVNQLKASHASFRDIAEDLKALRRLGEMAKWALAILAPLIAVATFMWSFVKENIK